MMKARRTTIFAVLAALVVAGARRRRVRRHERDRVRERALGQRSGRRPTNSLHMHAFVISREIRRRDVWPAFSRMWRKHQRLPLVKGEP
jgi:hypothetical protein